MSTELMREHVPTWPSALSVGTYNILSRLSTEEFRFHCTTVSPVLHILPAIVAAFMVSWDEQFYSLLEVFVLFYQTSCHSCFHLTIIFKFVVARILLQG